MQKAKTSSGATAVHIAREQHGISTTVEHIGPAQAEEDVAALVRVATERIRAGRPASGLSEGERTETTDVFVGRADLLADVSRRLERGRNVLLVGPSGVGKSRLAAEVLRVLPHRGSEALLAGIGTARYRFGLFAAGTSIGVGAADPVVLFDRYLRRWRRMGTADGPVVLWVDDAPHIDALSAALLRQAAVAGIAQVVATARTAEAVPGDIVSVAAADVLDVIDVPPLPDEEAAVLARQIAGEGSDPGEITRIVGMARGYPLFIRALARKQGASGLQTVDAVLDSRIRTLAADQRRVVEVIAAAGLADWRLFDTDGDALADLVRSGLVVWADPKHVRLEHPLYGALILERLGPLIEDVFASLVSRSDGLDIDSVLLADWTISAGRAPGPELAEIAAHIAIERTDADMAMRLAPFTGERTDLIRGQALLLAGRAKEGLDVLGRVRTAAAGTMMGAEAASSSARHIGLSMGDFPTAHRVLSEAEGDQMSREGQRLLLLTRLWLWIFGPLPGNTATRIAAKIAPLPDEPAMMSHEILVAGYAVMLQVSGVTHLGDARAKLLATERRIEVDGFLWARTRAVEAGLLVHAGKLADCLHLLEEALEDERSLSPTATRLIGANATFYAAMAGRFTLAAHAAERARAIAGVEDVFRFGEQARLFHEGTFFLRREGPNPEEWAANPFSEERALSVEIVAAARSRCLREPGSDIRDVVDALLRAGSLGWLALFYADAVDASNSGVHERVAAAFESVECVGLWSLVREAARARADADADRLLAAAEEYRRAGFLSGSTRAVADILRMPGIGRPTVLSARRTGACALFRWEGAPPAWVRASGLPTARQMDAIRRIVIGESVPEIADTWCVSRRTVENHVFRAAHGLGVSGADGLRGVLADGE